MTASIRPAVAADAEAIQDVRLASWRAAYESMIPAEAFAEFDRQQAVTRLIARLSDGRTRALVAERRARIVAFCTFGASRDDDVPGAAEVYGLYALPEHWSTGVGRWLFTAAVSAMEVRPVVLWVLRDNARARRFYEIAGWMPDGTQQDAVLLGGVVRPEVRYRLG